MYMLPYSQSPLSDPLEERRLRSGRPATRAEIQQRYLNELDQNTRFIAHESMAPDRVATRSRSRSMPTMVEHFRRSLSNALSAAAERISPETA